MSAFTQQPQPAPTAPSYSEKQFLHTQTAAVIVPLMQSAVTGLIVLVVSIVLAYKLNARDLFTWPLVFGVVAFGGMWFLLTRRWISLTNIERMTGIDINRDGHVGTPKQATAPTVIRFERVEAGRYTSRDIRLSASDKVLNQLADGFTHGRPFTEREWTGAGKPFSSDGFRALRSEMLKAGLIEQKSEHDPRQGFQLTEDGEAWRKKYASTFPNMEEL